MAPRRTIRGYAVRDPLKCGECGHAAFSLDHLKPEAAGRVGGQGEGGFEGTILVVCLGCSSETVLSTAPSRLATDNGGTLCGGWKGKERSGC